MDPACPPALMLLAVTTRVLELGPLVAAGDAGAVAQTAALAQVLGQGSLQEGRK